jgi:IS5 family transposase
MLKMLLLCSLYGMTHRRVEEYVNDSLSAKCFLGLAVDEPAPDHTTLSVFKGRIEEQGGERFMVEILAELIRQAVEQGIEFGSVQVADSTNTVADVNTGKDEHRQKKDGKGPRDGSARWGVKHTRKRRDERGEVVRQKQYFYGFKMHASMNALAELITSVLVTPGNAHDGKQFPHLVGRDEVQGLPTEIYSADRGYDDGANHYLLHSKGLKSAIHLNAYRTQKKDKNKEVWVALKQSEAYQEGQKERYKIERKFGEAKQNHSLRRCRYLGWKGYMIQAYMTVLALNLKRMVKLLTGTPFRGKTPVLT